MTKTIKIFLVVLILAASFVVFRIFFLFSNRLDTAVAVNDPVKVEYDESNDYDHDGLSNTDEAYWNTDPFKADTDGDGFLDGEEVLSKHDPMDSGPEDSFEEKSKIFTSNFTKGLSGLVVAGLAAGDLKRSADDKTFDDAVEKISLAAIYDALDVLENISLKDENFNIVEATLENQQNYVNKVSEITEDGLIKIFFGQPEEISRFFINTADEPPEYYEIKIKNAFLDHASKFQKGYDSLYEYPVPKNWIDTHKEGLLLLKKLEMHYRSIALSSDDPLKMMVVLGNLQTIYIETQPFLEKMTRQIKSNNLAVPNGNLLNTANGLYNL